MQLTQFNKRIIKTKNLKNTDISKICNLKNQHWKYGIKKQKIWFSQNYNQDDVHYLIFFKNNLIGYLHLGIKKLETQSKKKKYVLFRNLIVDKKFRFKGIAENIMFFANNYIKKQKKIGFLICKFKLIKFYKKYGWKRCSKKKIILTDHKHSKMFFMIFNFNQKKKIKFFYKT